MWRPPEPSQNLTPEGHYIFAIREEPENRRGKKNGVYIIFRFKAKDIHGETFNHNDVFAPFEPRYTDLLFALGAKADEKGTPHLHEIDPVGLKFEADIVHERDKDNPTVVRAKITNIISPEKDIPPPPDSDESIPF